MFFFIVTFLLCDTEKKGRANLVKGNPQVSDCFVVWLIKFVINHHLQAKQNYSYPAWQCFLENPSPPSERGRKLFTPLIYPCIFSFFYWHALLWRFRPEKRWEIAICDCNIISRKIKVYSGVYSKVFPIFLLW